MKEIAPVRVITDSTSAIPNERIAETGIGVVPASINFGNKSYLEGIDMGIDALLERMKQSAQLPTTAASGLGEYLKVYQQSEDPTMAIYLGSGFSAIHSTGEAAAREADPDGKRIHVFDSGTASMGVGFMALRAAQLSKQGANLDQIATELESIKKRLTVMASLDTLENARKGGRTSAIEAHLGALLQIKPILRVDNNKLRVIEKPRTRGRSLTRLVEITEALGELEYVAVLYADTPDEATGIYDQIKRFHHGEMYLGPVGAVLTVHGGPGVIGICAVKKR